MEEIAHTMTNYLIRKNVIAMERSSIYKYGILIGLEVCLNTVISIIIAVLCHMEWETLVFFAVFTLLRSYAGGLHLSSYSSCLICSCMSLLGLLLVVKHLNIDNSYSIGIVLISLFIIKLLAPVEDINRPISPSELWIFRRMLNRSIIKIIVLAIIFYLMKLDRLLLMISVTTMFMVGILVLGKINYKKCIRKCNVN